MAIDDKQIFSIVRDISGGMNNRQHGSNIAKNQMTLLKNVDIGVPGDAKKRPGLTLIEDLGNNAGYGLFGFEPAGGTDELMAIEDTNLKGWTGSGSFATRKSDFTAGTASKMLKVGEEGENDVLVIKIDGNNWFRMLEDHTFQDLGSTSGSGTDSPPASDVAEYFRNRWWILKDNHLYYSTAFPADYSSAFNTTSGWYLIPVGEERAIIGVRDTGLVVIGSEQIWGINPSVTPAATDKAEKLLEIGCVAKKTAIQVGDDILFMAKDGVRALFRTVQDKLQSGASFPLSFPLKDEVESINWAQISKATAIFFDNKYFISLPVDSSSYNNEVWIYYPAFQSWIVVTGWNVADWATMQVNGEERLYAIDSNDGKVYQAWKGYDDNGTAIDYDEQGRKEDFDQPLITKSGGEVKIKAYSSGNYDLTIQVSIDDQDWADLGTINLTGNAPTLPVSLPFDLADTNIISATFHLDSLGPFNQIRLRIRHNDTNGSDDIRIFERQIITFADEYQSE